MIIANPILSGSVQISGSLNVNGESIGANSVSSSYSTTSVTSSFALTVSNSVTGSLTTKVDNQNANSGSLSFWQGSQAEYDALGLYDQSTVYFIV